MVSIARPPATPEEEAKLKAFINAFWEAQELASGEKYSEDQPRDESGRWTDGTSTVDFGDLDNPGVAVEEYTDAEDGLASAEKLGETAVKALSIYRHSGYITINHQLRDGAVDEKQGRIVAAIDAAFEKSHVRQPVVVYRGIRQAVLDGIKPGDKITDRGFVSTSFSRREAAGMLSKELVTIKVPTGSKAIYMHKATGEEAPAEMELLLPRDSSFRVVDTHKSGRGISAVRETTLELL